MKIRALWSKVPGKRVFFKTIFGFSILDILKMSIFQNQIHFLEKIVKVAEYNIL
jgi:hypothetical protein